MAQDPPQQGGPAETGPVKSHRPSPWRTREDAKPPPGTGVESAAETVVPPQVQPAAYRKLELVCSNSEYCAISNRYRDSQGRPAFEFGSFVRAAELCLGEMQAGGVRCAVVGTGLTEELRRIYKPGNEMDWASAERIRVDRVINHLEKLVPPGADADYVSKMEAELDHFMAYRWSGVDEVQQEFQRLQAMNKLYLGSGAVQRGIAQLDRDVGSLDGGVTDLPLHLPLYATMYRSYGDYDRAINMLELEVNRLQRDVDDGRASRAQLEQAESQLATFRAEQECLQNSQSPDTDCGFSPQR